MARAKKNGTYLNVCIDSYFCDYREKQRKLKELRGK